MDNKIHKDIHQKTSLLRYKIERKHFDWFYDTDRIMPRPIWRLESCMYGILDEYKF